MRVKRGTTARRRHKKVFEAAKGYRGTKRHLIRSAHEAILHAGAYAFHGRKRKKRDFRQLWITRINEAVKLNGLSYREFINKMKKSNVALDRKILTNLIINDPSTFKHIVDKVKTA